MLVKELRYRKETFRYVDEGQGNPLLFIHGWGVSPVIYQHTIYELAKKYRVIAPFFREGNTDNSMEKLVNLLDTLNIQKVILVAHSASGILAIQLAYHLPKRIRALVLVGTIGVGKQSAKKMFFNWMSHMKGMLIGVQREEKPFLGRLVLDFATQIVRFPLSFIKETKYILEQDVTNLFADLTMPILIVWAKDDKLVPMSIGDGMTAINKRAVLKVVDGGHNWVKVHPGLLLKYITEFIQ